MKGWHLLFLIFFIVGCGNSSFEDYRESGGKLIIQLIAELSNIQSKEQLQAAAPKIKKHFSQLAEVMISAQEFQRANANLIPPPLSQEEIELSEKLRSELSRLFLIPGGREIIEKCQSDALLKLVKATKDCDL